MKKLIAVIAILAFATVNASALKLAWDPTTDISVTSISVYQDASLTPIGSVLVPTTTFSLPLLTAGPHSFYITALNISGESPKSNVVTVPGLPSAPVNLKVVP